MQSFHSTWQKKFRTSSIQPLLLSLITTLLRKRVLWVARESDFEAWGRHVRLISDEKDVNTVSHEALRGIQTAILIVVAQSGVTQDVPRGQNTILTPSAGHLLDVHGVLVRSF